MFAIRLKDDIQLPWVVVIHSSKNDFPKLGPMHSAQVYKSNSWFDRINSRYPGLFVKAPLTDAEFKKLVRRSEQRYQMPHALQREL